MKKFAAVAALLLMITGCSHTSTPRVTTQMFNPDLQIVTSDQWQLVANTTSSQPIATDNQVHQLAMFAQTQTWLTPATTTMTVSYPYVVESSAAALAFNNHVRDLVADEVASFLSQAATEVDPDWSDLPNEITIEGQVLAVTSPFISVDFTVSPYYSGAAHPGLYSRTLNFDLTAERTLALDDIIAGGETNLLGLQAQVLPRLVSVLNAEVEDAAMPFSADDEWILTGTAPSSTNYANLALTKTGLRVQFDPYQVAAYALGAPEVTIPYAELGNLLVPGLITRVGLN